MQYDGEGADDVIGNEMTAPEKKNIMHSIGNKYLLKKFHYQFPSIRFFWNS